MSAVYERVLSNGCKVIVRPTPGKRILAIVAGVPWGGRDDAPEIAGRSRLMSELLTKGTTTRSALQIAEEIESVGGSIESWCGSDQMGIDVQVVQDDWELALNLMGDCLFNSVFSPDEFDKEREVTRAHLLREMDDKFSFTYRAFQGLYYRGHPYAEPPVGNLQSIDALRPEMMAPLAAGVVRPERMVVTVVGNVPEAALLGRLEELWPAADPTISVPARAVAQAAPGDGRGEKLEIRREFEQGMIILGYPSPRPGLPETAALRLACGILGEGMSARLFARLRDRDHLAYSVGSSLVLREMASHLLLHIGTGPRTLDIAREGLLREARGLIDEKPDAAEIERAREYILGKYLISRQTNSALAHAASTYEIMGLGWEYGDTLPERIKAVDAEQIQAAADACFRNPAEVVLRPEEGKDEA
jgi:predicted Zn-dependent peptidase